ASACSPAQAGSSTLTSAATPATTCSQLSSTRSSARSASALGRTARPVDMNRGIGPYRAIEPPSHCRAGRLRGEDCSQRQILVGGIVAKFNHRLAAVRRDLDSEIGREAFVLANVPLWDELPVRFGLTKLHIPNLKDETARKERKLPAEHLEPLGRDPLTVIFGNRRRHGEAFSVDNKYHAPFAVRLVAEEPSGNA